MGTEDLQEEVEKTAFTWEVKANNSAYHQEAREKGFLCWKKKKYKTNTIHTAKYNFFSFLPRNLYEQFHRMSNLYFLLVIILQSIPEISTLPWFTLFAPFICLLSIRGTRDLVDDIGRHRSDKAINNRPCQILTGKRFTWRKWKDLCVGDVVCLSKDSIVPADLLLLASTEPSSLCYVETVDIDGETNLKFKQALTVTHSELTSTRKMASFDGTVLCEEPNSRMHHFVGSLEWNGRKYPLDIGNLLLRGCRVRNTDTCYGLVIYAGFDTKIMKNCGKIHLKRTKLDILMNNLVVVIFVSLVVISLGLALAFSIKVKEFKEKHFYISASHPHSVAMESFLIFWGFLILLSVMVPLAMFVIAEFIYLGNSIFINWDMKMYSAPQDVPARARSTSLNDQLGQVEYIFSDKTGTLTQNIMTFKKCCISGHIFGPESKDRTPPQEDDYHWNKFADQKCSFYNKELLHLVLHRRKRAVQEFWRLLAICHTVMVHHKDDELVYQAASPDEEALVTAARNFGYVFLSRTQDTLTVLELGEERVYQVLAMMDFNSVRKRMSVLVRNPEGSIYLYTKGADTVILERLHKRGPKELATEEVLSAFAEETLRTLCLAYKEVDEVAYRDWQRQHEAAALQLQSRAQALQELYSHMEQDLKLLGVTAIEDRLQDGVPDTIRCLKKGNVKVWMLTGDKQETAVNIGFACQLLSENVLILEEKEINCILEAYWENNNNVQEKKDRLKFLAQTKMALVINGDFLDQLLLSLRKEPRALVRNAVVDENSQEAGLARRDFLQARRISLMWRNLGAPGASSANSTVSRTHKHPEVQREQAFVDLASRCQAVICCRVTPKQKALVVALVKKYKQVVTLAIGDGANDVNMIKTADIGVGLTGQEGMQAVQNSDFVLAQFSFLQRLLLVHGRWSYMRVCKFLRYFFYKTVASMMAQIWFAFYSGFSAQPLYEGWFLALFNLLYSTLPVLYIGLFEQDVSADKSLDTPELYIAGQKDEFFNYWVFLQAIGHGMATSIVNFFVSLCISHNLAGPASFSDYQSFGAVVALSSLLSITLEVILIIRYWTFLCVLTIVVSLGSYVVMTSATQSLWLYELAPATFPFLYVDRNVLTCPSALLVILLNVSLNTLPVLALRVIHKALKKPRLREGEEGPTEETATAEPVPGLRRELPARRSSYAFSHREGYADLITQGTSLRKSPKASAEVVSDSPAPSDEELSPNGRDSLWNLRKLSSLRMRRRPSRGGVSSEDAQVSSAVSSTVTAETQASAKRPPAPPGRPSEALEGSRPSSPARAQQAPDGQPEPRQARSSWTPFWKSWSQHSKDDAPALGARTQASLAESFVSTREEPSLNELPMEVESWSVERQPSPMEWLPVPFQSQNQPRLSAQDHALPPRSEPERERPSLKDKGSKSSPFSNKPGSS